MSVPACRSTLLPLLLLAVAVLLFCPLASADSSAVELAQHWQYRWGDSPFDAEGVPQWSVEHNPGAWSPIAFPSNPPGREGRENVWYRTVLPDGDWRDPVLYIFSVDLIVEVYLDGERIYRYGEFDAQGKGRFAGWPWHMIPLPARSAGKEIYFRVFSNYYDIGLWGEVKVMERLELLRKVIDQSLEGMIVAGFNLLIALLSTLFALLRSERRTFLAIALYALASAGIVISDSEANLLLWYRPLLWEFIGANAYFLTPVAMALLLEQWFHSAIGRLYNLIWKFNLLFLVVANLFVLGDLLALSDIYPAFDLIFTLTLILLFVPALARLKHADREQILILAAYTPLSLLLMLDMAVAHGLLPWGQPPLSWGSLAFSVAIVSIALLHYSRTQKMLGQLNQSLEAKVQQRTGELKRLALRESARARVLALENHKSSQLGEIIAALQNCTGLEQSRAVLSARLPALCQPMPGALYLLGSVGYELETSWGYPPGERPPRHIATSPAPTPRQGDTHWYFPISFERNRQECLHLGLLLLHPGDRVDAELYNLEQLYQLVNRGVEKICLTLSILSLHDELQRFSYEDALTGIKNRRYLDEALAREIDLAKRSNTPLSVMICDIDHFKRFNDSHGHAAGDAALQHLASHLARAFRHTDIICRYGGEEFVVVLPDASAEECRARTEELRQQVGTDPIRFDGKELEPVTLSAGITTWPTPTSDSSQLLSCADRALYRAKQRGRDRIELCC